MPTEWIVVFLMIAFVIGMQIAICLKISDIYVFMGRTNQEHQIERKKDEETFKDIKAAIPNRIEMHGDTYKMYHK